MNWISVIFLKWRQKKTGNKSLNLKKIINDPKASKKGERSNTINNTLRQSPYQRSSQYLKGRQEKTISRKVILTKVNYSQK